MGLCNIGGKDGYLRKMISDKLNSLGVTVAKAYDSAATFVANIQTAVNNADAAGYTRGSSDAKQGTATEGQVLTGYTFTNQNGLYSGSMPNRGALNWNPTTSTTYSVLAGYYSGGTLNSSNAYNSGGSANRSLTINSYLLSGTYRTVTSATAVKVGGRTCTVTPSSGATVYCFGSVHSRCFNNTDETYGSGGACIFFSTSSFTVTNNDYATVKSVVTVTNGNGRTIYACMAYGTWGGQGCTVGGNTVSSRVWIDDNNYSTMAAALSNFFIV